jgi:hypothetical protein
MLRVVEKRKQNVFIYEAKGESERISRSVRDLCEISIENDALCGACEGEKEIFKVETGHEKHERQFRSWGEDLMCALKGHGHMKCL